MNKFLSAALLLAILMTVSALADVSITTNSVTPSGIPGASATFSLIASNTEATTATLTFSNFTLTHADGYLLAASNPGPITIQAANTATIPFTVPIPSNQVAGVYIGRIQMTSGNFSDSTGVVLTVQNTAPVAGFDIPTFVKLGSSSTRFNSSVSNSFNIVNTGSVTLTNLRSTISANSKYRLELNGLPLTLSPGQSASVTLNGYVPGDISNQITAGTLSVVSDQITKTMSIDIQGTGALSIRRVRFDWDGRGDSVKDGDTVDTDIRPGSEITLRVEFENLYSRSEGIDIDNVDVEITVEDIDDGDDIDDNFDFDIRADSRKEITMRFNVPLNTDEDTYTIDIFAEGEDDNNNIQTASARVHFRVEKERHDVRITRFSVTPSSVSCSPRSLLMSLELTNYGRDEEDRISLGIREPTLGIEINQFNIELDNDLDDADSRYRRDIRFTVPDSVRPGTYPVELTAFNTNDFSAFQIADVTVIACATTPPVVVPPTTAPSGPTVPAEPTGSVTAPVEGVPSNLPFILVLAGLNVVLLLVIVVVLGRVMGRRQ